MKLNLEFIRENIRHKELSFELYDTISSTNTVLKQRGRNGAPHGLVLAATHQTEGRGRMGRQFYSPAETGLYFSLLLRPALKATDSLLITTAAAVAVAQVLEKYTPHKAQIKWVNDIYIDEKKVCGILTEAAVKADGYLDYAVLGIGINIAQPKNGFPDEINHIAGSLLHSHTEQLHETILTEVLNVFMDMLPNLSARAHIDAYRKRSMLDGTEINVLKNDKCIPATALYVDENLCLAVQYKDGTVEHLYTGDVSIRRA